LVIGLLVLLPVCFAFGRWSAASQAPRYENPALRFRLQGPDFAVPAKDESAAVLSLFAPATDAFSANLNVVVQPPTTPAEYRRVSLEEFRQFEFEIRHEESVKVCGREGMLVHYTGELQGTKLEWLSLAVFDAEHTYLVTCTATPTQYAALETKFRASLDTFEILDAPDVGAGNAK